MNKTTDVTRSTVQKSVCVLAALPLYGLIKTKLDIITHAYFNERNFDRVEVLAEMYKSLCAAMMVDPLANQVYIGKKG